MQRRHFLMQSGAAATASAWSGQALAAYTPSVLHLWNETTCAAIAHAINGPTVGARSLAMVFEAIYNAWAAYGNAYRFTLSGLRTMPKSEWTTSLKTIAISHAAHKVLNNLYPLRGAEFDAALTKALANQVLTSRPALAAIQLGEQCGVALLQSRANDGSNQANNYIDTTSYSPGAPNGLNWEPLELPPGSGKFQTCMTPHWGGVRPFALAHGAALRPVWTRRAPTPAEMNELLQYSAALDDRMKCQVDFFANNPGSVTPPGQWMQFCQLVSRNDNNSLDRDVILFCLVAQAMLDASIAAWDCKRSYDYIRPISAIRRAYAGQTITAWTGVGGGPGPVAGELWKPYQRDTSPTPNFPEFVSGHSTFSGAAAGVIAALRGDSINLSFTWTRINFDPSVPSAPVVFSWSSLSEVAAAAGMSRRYGGIHFEPGDLLGRELGAKVAKVVLLRAYKLVRDDD